MFSYPGGKNRHAKWIIPLLPTNHLTTYCEVFGGAFWVYQRLHTLINCTTVYNDLNAPLANSWYCMSKHWKELLTLCQSIPAEDNDLYNEYRNELYPTDADADADVDISLGDVDRAAKYLYLETQRYIGVTPVGPKSKMVRMDGVKYRPKWEVFVDRLADGRLMLEHINYITSLDFAAVINRFDSPTTLFYVDPPYFGTEHYYTEGDFSVIDHQRLAETLRAISGKFALSYYDFAGLSDLYPQSLYQWHIQPVVKSMGTTRTNTTASRGEELLIMNYTDINQGKSQEQLVDSILTF